MTSWVGYAMRFKSYEFRIREWVCASTKKWIPRDLFFPHFSRIENEFFCSTSLLLLFRLLFLFLLTSFPMLEAVVCKSNTVRSARTLLNVELNKKKNQVSHSFFLESFKLFFFHFTILKVRIERCKKLQLYKSVYGVCALSATKTTFHCCHCYLLNSRIKIMMNMYELELKLYLNSCMIAFSRYLNERIKKSSVNKLLRLFLFRVLLLLFLLLRSYSNDSNKSPRICFDLNQSLCYSLFLILSVRELVSAIKRMSKTKPLR